MRKLLKIKNLDLESIISKNRHVHLKNIDKYYYVIHIILSSSINCHTYFKYVNINKELLRKNLGGNIALDILKNLETWNIINKNEKYQSGLFSQSYKLNKDFFGDNISLIKYIPKEFKVCKILKSKNIFKRDQLYNFLHESINKLSFDMNLLLNNIYTLNVENFNDFDKINLISSIYIQSNKHNSRINLVSEFEEIETLLSEYFIQFGLENKVFDLKNKLSEFIDKDKKDLLIFFKNHESEYPCYYGTKALSYDSSISRILTKDFYIKKSKKTGRFFSNITNLKKEFRSALITNENKELYELDIKCSQPFFCAILLAEKYKGKEIPYSLIKYIELTTTGELYNYIHNLHEFDKIESIDEIKKTIYKDLFFCKNFTSYNSKYFRVLKHEFPEVIDFITYSKKENYKDFAIKLQRAESDFILQFMGNKFKDENLFFVSIHDSVIMEKDGIEFFKKHTKEYFNKFAIYPQLHENYLGKQ